MGMFMCMLQRSNILANWFIYTNFTVSVSIIIVIVRKGLTWFLLIVLNLSFFDLTFLQLPIIMLSWLGSFDHSVSACRFLSQFNLNGSWSRHHWVVLNPKWEIWGLCIVRVVPCNLIPWFFLSYVKCFCVCVLGGLETSCPVLCVSFGGSWDLLSCFLSYGWKMYTAFKLMHLSAVSFKICFFPYL